MVLTTDVLLKGQIWAETIDNLAPLFKRPNYDIFMLCTAIGIMYDQRIESFEEIEEPALSESALQQLVQKSRSL